MNRTPVRGHAWLYMIAGGLLLILGVSCASLHRDKTVHEDAGGEDRGEIESAAVGHDSESDVVFVANLFCEACHMDFGEEQLALAHERVGIGCERCHGESLRHRSDEANITPPQLMYPRNHINPTCMMCHARHAIRHVEAHQGILEAGLSVFEDEMPHDTDGPVTQACIDCHGREHKMKVRTIRWDKCTGEVLP